MNFEQKDRFFGVTLKDWISKIPNELEVDAIGLWQVIPPGRDNFGLTGQDLIEFVRYCLLAILDRGAVPVIGLADEPNIWIRRTNLGASPREIADSVIAEWIESGIDPTPQKSIWFALPTELGP